MQKFQKTELVLFLFLLLTAAFLRFSQLGYSDFYGDETKTLFVRKDISAQEFFLDQRKGPVQFLAVWFMEKVTGGFDEGLMRLPFALAGFLSVIVFYFVVKKLLNEKIALISAFLFNLEGFYVAFSRTVQYQSFLVLFGFLSILFAISYGEKKRPLFLIFSAVFLGFSFLAHYDAVFFAIPVIFILLFGLSGTTQIIDRNYRKTLFWYFVLPFFLSLAWFYIPYIAKGYLSRNIFGYLARRVSGKEFPSSNSIYTYLVYNPRGFSLWVLLYSALPIFGYLKNIKNIKNAKKILLRKLDTMLFAWFLVPFLLFTFIFSNPGTHIHNFIIPLFIFASMGIIKVHEFLKARAFRFLYLLILSVVFVFFAAIQFCIYVPFLNKGYPWKESTAFLFPLERADKNNHLFLYGFPYYRGWDKVRDYLYSEEGVRNYYTNDNVTISEYYLNRFDAIWVNPQYFIDVENNQEFREVEFGEQNYNLERVIEFDGDSLVQIFRRVEFQGVVKL